LWHAADYLHIFINVGNGRIDATEAGRAKEELAPEIESPRPDISVCQLE